MRVWLARHGETLWNRERRVQGVTDVPLSDLGRRQAALLGDLLSGARPEAVYCSPLSRARDTGRAVAARHGLELRIRPGLQELNQGVLEGKTFAEMVAGHGDLVREWWRDPGDQRLPGGESMMELQARAWAVLDEIRTGPEREVVVVSHNMTIRAILARALEQSLAHVRRFRLSPASLCRIAWSGAPWPQVELVGYDDHTRGAEA
ncbi:MAG: histidine phosphatase family protein [Candidatus Methylomirabilis sp.]|nr:histidine phosphatase family protein [Deltaproteobacteria bacterium]